MLVPVTVSEELKQTHIHTEWRFIQGAPKRPDTFENLIEIKRVDENN